VNLRSKWIFRSAHKHAIAHTTFAVGEVDPVPPAALETVTQCDRRPRNRRNGWFRVNLRQPSLLPPPPESMLLTMRAKQSATIQPSDGDEKQYLNWAAMPIGRISSEKIRDLGYLPLSPSSTPLSAGLLQRRQTHICGSSGDLALRTLAKQRQTDSIGKLSWGSNSWCLLVKLSHIGKYSLRGYQEHQHERTAYNEWVCTGGESRLEGINSTHH